MAAGVKLRIYHPSLDGKYEVLQYWDDVDMIWKSVTHVHKYSRKQIDDYEAELAAIEFE